MPRQKGFTEGFGDAFLPTAEETLRETLRHLLTQQANEPFRQAQIQSLQESTATAPLRRKLLEAQVGNVQAEQSLNQAKAKNAGQFGALQMAKEDPGLFSMAVKLATSSPLAKLGLVPDEELMPLIQQHFNNLKSIRKGTAPAQAAGQQPQNAAGQTGSQNKIKVTLKSNGLPLLIPAQNFDPKIYDKR